MGEISWKRIADIELCLKRASPQDKWESLSRGIGLGVDKDAPYGYPRHEDLDLIREARRDITDLLARMKELDIENAKMKEKIQACPICTPKSFHDVDEFYKEEIE